MAKKMTKEQLKEHRKGAIEMAKLFFQALKDGKDWRPFAQKHYSDWDIKARPLIMAFDEYSVGEMPSIVKGANPEACVGVYVKIRVSVLGSSLPQRYMKGRIAVWCETGTMEPSPEGTWGVAPNSFSVSEGSNNLDI